MAEDTEGAGAKRPTPRKRSGNGRNRKDPYTGETLPSAPPRTTKHPWHQIKEAYVEGIESDNGDFDLPTYKELADRFGVSHQQIANRASKERWTALRATFQHKQGIERQKKRAATIANDAAKFDEQGHNAAKLGMAMVLKRLADIATDSKESEGRIAEARKRRNAGQPVEAWEVRSPIYHNELLALANAAEKFQSLGMRALGTDVQRHEITGSIENTHEHTLNIGQELHRDDPDRLTGFILGLQDAGIAGILDDAIDAEVIEDEDGNTPTPEGGEENDNADNTDTETTDNAPGSVEDTERG